MRRGWWSLLSCLVLAPAAQSADLWVNPGTMGPNALIVEPGDTAHIPERFVVRLSGAVQRTRAGDESFTPVFRIEAPFGRWASMISQGRPYEWWRVAPETKDAWQLASDSGSVGGDLSFGVKFRAFHGGARLPTISVRNMTKSTTGKGFYDRRHTNGPGYLLDLLVTQPLVRVGTMRLEAWGALGFLAWQQGRNGQNDAPNWSLTLAGRFDSGSLVRLDVRGFDGWQTDDKPRVVAATGEWALGETVSLFVAANVGLRDAPLVDAHLGLVLRLPALLPISLDDTEADDGAAVMLRAP